MFLDTSAYSELERGAQPITELVREYSSATLALPVIAELRYGFIRGSEAARNEATLQRFLSQPQVSVAFPTMRTTEIYAELQYICKQKGCQLGINDLWIAAMAREADERLVTFDKDFGALADAFGDKLLILVNGGL